MNCNKLNALNAADCADYTDDGNLISVNSQKFFFELLFLVLVLFSFCSFSQENEFTWPLSTPISITGNYGELRPNHFHAGLDFSTEGKENVPVACIADGYVSRIKVSSVGYGKGIYITHSNGKVSVYAHLNSYNSTITTAVKKEQYSKMSYEIDYYPKKDEFKIKQGQIIGFSGNTGGSTGPHLHLEIRDEKSEVPLNPLEYFHIEDNIAPIIEKIAFYNLSDTCSPKYMSSYKVKKNNSDSLFLEKDTIVLQQGILGLAFSGYDKYKAGGNPNNIFAARVYFDNMLVHSHRLDQIDFPDARFVNEFSENIDKVGKFQKCFMPTLYPANLYEKRPTKGRILLSDTNYHKLKLAVHDENGNERVLEFTFKTRKLNFYARPSIKSDVYVNCSRDFMVSKNKLQIFIPANTLYYSTGLIFENTIETTRKIMILPREANLKSTSIVGFEIPFNLRGKKEKLVLSSGSSVSVPIVKRDSVFYSVKNLGSFLLEIDTVAPVIKTKLPLAKLKSLKIYKSIAFIISDNLSGIGKYNMYLNEKWVIGEYDAKTNTITYYFDEQTPVGDLKIKLEVEDRVGNKGTLVLGLKR